MLDYDGTLAPFRKNRRQAFPYPGVSLLLEGIIRSGRTRVVIISGRYIQEIVLLLGIDPSPEIWGLHGLQRLQPDGQPELLPVSDSTVKALAAAEKELHRLHLQHLAEFKEASIAVHWRGLRSGEAASVLRRVLASWRPIAQSECLHMLEFDGGLEICAPEADKGGAVRTILSEVDPDTFCAYLGDDATDEYAFQAIDGQGLSILVRPQWRDTLARSWLKPPEELIDFLTGWSEACQKDAPSHEAAIGANR